MAKFYGVIGYGETVEIRPGVMSEVITERNAYGDLTKTSRRFEDGPKVNNDLTVGNSISIVADAYANEHFFAIRYVKWSGAYWHVTEVTVERPRLILRLGGVYNGPKAPVSSTP